MLVTSSSGQRSKLSGKRKTDPKMKDFTVKNIPKDAVYKDVVIIGNGPSGITLSYMLAGNWPYWTTEKVKNHPDELLRARLNYADSNRSLVEQDLVMLAEGLEGRSTNPISLLFDNLEHPCADMGMELPSMLEYRNHTGAQIDHIVLGKGPPGGSWHRMDPNLRTLSLASWMSLPGLSYNDWETVQLRKELTKNVTSQNEDNKAFTRQRIQFEQDSTCQKCIEMRSKKRSQSNVDDCLENNNESESGALCCQCTKALTTSATSTNNSLNSSNKLFTDSQSKMPRRNLSLKRQTSKEVQARALVSRVAQYYKDYVHLMNLEKYFLNDTIVTLIAPVKEGCIHGKLRKVRWVTIGINKATGKTFCYVSANVILANGASDLANRLGLHGEDTNASWVKHDLPQLEVELESLSERERSQLKPVLVIGAGLSAADAVAICRSSDIHVIHVFRSRTAGLDKMLPENVYPEYHEVHRMMKDSNKEYEFYTPVPEHTISDLTTEPDGTHKVTVQNLNSGETKSYEVSFCAILIGSKPDLRFTSGLSKCTTRSIFITSSQLSGKSTNSPEYSMSSSPLSRKISWLKSFCVKCRNLNLCDWSRRNDYRKVCGHNNDCDCVKVTTEKEGSACPETFGLGLGLDPTKPIDCKSNQIAVDKYTNEVLRAPKGLFAMGPLVGDNFVRFIPGGALAITAALNKEND